MQEKGSLGLRGKRPGGVLKEIIFIKIAEFKSTP